MMFLEKNLVSVFFVQNSEEANKATTNNIIFLCQFRGGGDRKKNELAVPNVKVASNTTQTSLTAVKNNPSVMGKSYHRLIKWQRTMIQSETQLIVIAILTVRNSQFWKITEPLIML